MTEEFLEASEFLYDLPVGTVLETSREEQEKNPHRPAMFVFVGWRRNTVRDEMMFCELFHTSKYYPKPCEPWIYHCSGYETALRKFPGLKEYVRERVGSQRASTD